MISRLFLKVAWVHLDRQMIITIHRQVVARIGRFSVSFDHQRTWHLHIRGVQQEDAGRYMCQVNSEPMISQVGHVHVVGAYTFTITIVWMCNKYPTVQVVSR